MSQKLENLLNLALDADQGERERSEELDVGYDKEENVWELIVKYSGTLEAVRQTARSVTELLNGYAVIVIEEERIGQLAQLPEVEFIEKPKKLYFQTDVGRQVSCIDIVQDMPLSLRGKGTLIGIVDSGIDYENAEFRNEDGTTRIVSLWDQSVNGRPPAGYLAGTEYTREQIDAALATEDKEVRRQMVKTSDVSGHGTAVAGIAAGNGRGSEGRRFRGAAPEAELIIVKRGGVVVGDIVHVQAAAADAQDAGGAVHQIHLLQHLTDELDDGGVHTAGAEAGDLVLLDGFCSSVDLFHLTCPP